MKVYDYSSYEEYVANQTEANKRKLKNVWVHQTTMAAIVRWYERKIGQPKSVLCHGTRNGAEQSFFRRHSKNNMKILGTEISETATDFPDTVQWDFTRQKDAWIGAWDIVYSNSFDHSPSPKETMQTWRDQLSENGVLVIDHTVWIDGYNNKPDRVDCLDISFQELEDMFVECGMVVKACRPFSTNNDHMTKVCSSFFYFAVKESFDGRS